MERRVLKYFLLLSLLAPLTLAAQRPAKGRKTVVQQPAPVSYDSLAMRRNELAGKEARLKERLDEARSFSRRIHREKRRSVPISWNSNRPCST